MEHSVQSHLFLDKFDTLLINALLLLSHIVVWATTASLSSPAQVTSAVINKCLHEILQVKTGYCQI